MDKELQPYQRGVVDEKAELDEKVTKLDAFMGTEAYFALPEPERYRMARQTRYMTSYSVVLGERIQAFA